MYHLYVYIIYKVCIILKLINYLREFVDMYGLKTEATSNVKIESNPKILNKSSRVYTRGDTFRTVGNT